MGFQVGPQLGALLQRLLGTVHHQKDAGNGHHHGEVVEHIVPQLVLLLRQGVQVHRVHHDAGHAQLLVHPLDHVLLVDALVLPADEIAVQVKIHVIHGMALGQRLVHKDVVHIEGVLGQLHLRLAQHLGAVDDAVHQDVFVRREPADLVPVEDAVLRQDALVVDGQLGVVRHMLIHIVAQQQIHRLLHGGEFPQLGHGLLQAVGIQPVIGIHDLEIQALRVADALIDALAVAAVLLMDDPHDVGVAGGELVCDFAGIVLGAIVHQNDLGVLPRGQQRLDAVGHIRGRVVARHGKGDEFHKALLHSESIPII